MSTSIKSKNKTRKGKVPTSLEQLPHISFSVDKIAHYIQSCAQQNPQTKSDDLFLQQITTNVKLDAKNFGIQAFLIFPYAPFFHHVYINKLKKFFTKNVHNFENVPIFSFKFLFKKIKQYSSIHIPKWIIDEIKNFAHLDIIAEKETIPFRQRFKNKINLHFFDKRNNKNYQNIEADFLENTIGEIYDNCNQ